MTHWISSFKHRGLRLFLILLIGAGWMASAPVGARGQSGGEAPPTGDRPEVFNLESSIEYAMAHHPGIASARSSLSASQAGLTVAKAIHRPIIGVSGNITKTLTSEGQLVVDDVLVEASNHTIDYYSLALNLTVPMFAEGWFVLGTLPSERIAGEDAETKRAELELAREEIVYNVTAAFFSALKANQDILLAEESLKFFESLLGEARVMFEREIITQDDLFASELVVNQARKDLVVSRNTYRLMLHNLAFEMGIDPSESIQLEETFPSLPDLPPLEDLIRLARVHRQEIAAQEFAVRSARDSLDLSRAERYPTANVSSVYRLTDDFRTPIQAQDWRVIFSMSLPIFDFGLTRAKVVQGTHAVRAMEETLAQIKRSVIQEIVQAYSDIQNQKEERAILDLQIKQAEGTLKGNREKFKQQLIPISSVLSAEQSLLNSQKALIKADYDRQIQIALLRKAVGGSWTP